MFANALMLPQFDYLDIVWMRSAQTRLDEIDIIYKRVAKIALDYDIQESSIKVYRDMKWLPLQLRRQLHIMVNYIILLYMYKIIHQQCPEKFKLANLLCLMWIKECQKMQFIHLSKSKSQKQFSYLGAKFWNSTSQHLRELSSFEKFDKEYKSILRTFVDVNDQFRPKNCFRQVQQLPNSK